MFVPISSTNTKLLKVLVNSKNSQFSQLSDAQFVCAYSEISAIFDLLSKRFEEQELHPEDCIALECENSVACALLLLYLIERGYSFLLIPKIVKSESISETAIPSFCRYRIRVEDSLNQAKSLQKLDQFLQIVENEAWVTMGENSDSSSGKLYLRTSGSTGSPKLVVHSHDKLLKNAQNCVNRWELDGKDRMTIPVPIFHMYGLGAAFLPGILAGASIDFQANSNLLKYLQREKDFNPNIAFLTPTFADNLLKGRRSTREYEFTVVAGDRLKPETFKEYEAKFGRLVPLYGSTELGAIAACSPEDSSELRMTTVGKPMFGVKVRVEKGDTDGVKNIEESGEIWCQHPYGFEGYIDESGKPINETYLDFRSKDWGKIGKDGYLEVLGRCDQSVNRDGLLVFFADVEKEMAKISGIETVVVVTQGESQRGKGLVAYCVLTSGVQITETEIRMACLERLPRRAIPDRVEILPTLPLLPNGKIDRQAIAKSSEKRS
jgi:acyl-CoA synthetase (AMP-forming)/AMP-acid ligase II